MSNNISWGFRLWFAWVAGLTFVYLFFGHAVVHPVDARNGMPVDWMHLEYPAWGAIVEPLAAPGHILINSLDFHDAAISMLVWVAGLAALFVWWQTRRLRSVVMALLFVTSMCLLYIAFMLLAPLPSWRLAVDRPGMIIADLHSHTYRSHDGLISLDGNLLRHQRHGYDVVAITEHANHETQYLFDDVLVNDRPGYPAVLAGVEVTDDRRQHLLAIGLKPGIAIDNKMTNKEQVQRWVDEVHNVHHGVVIALNLGRNSADIENLLTVGVDGIEVANAGHPKMSRSVRRTLLQANASGIPLVASSDFHGLGNYWYAWTVVRQQNDATAPAATVLAALRDHRASDIVPVSAHPMGAMSFRDIVAAPMTGILHYARELSPARLMGWWGWLLILWLMAAVLQRRFLRPGLVFAASVAVYMGGVLLYQGVSVLLLPLMQGLVVGDYLYRIVAIAMTTGCGALVLAWLLLSRAGKGKVTVF